MIKKLIALTICLVFTLTVWGQNYTTYSGKKGERLWDISKSQLVLQGKARPSNREIYLFMKEIAELNGIMLSEVSKLDKAMTLKIPAATKPQVSTDNTLAAFFLSMVIDPVVRTSASAFSGNSSSASPSSNNVSTQVKTSQPAAASSSTAKRTAAQELKECEEEASRGDMEAQNNLAHIYFTGKVGYTGQIAVDYKKAVYWWTKASNNGHEEAPYMLGECYANGWGVACDYNNAFKWYKLSADRNCTAGMVKVGDCYLHGKGVNQDKDMGAFYYSLASDLGNSDGQFSLGYCYLNGEGVKQDYAQAIALYTQAANNGNAQAQNNLGICYETGTGVAKDFSKAAYWYEKAAAQNSEVARTNLQNLKSRMSK